MRKYVLLTLFLLAINFHNLFAIGAGGAFSLSSSDSDPAIPGGALTLQENRWGPLLGLNFRVADDTYHLKVTADWKMLTPPLEDIQPTELADKLSPSLKNKLSYYIAFGGYVNSSFGEEEQVTGGLRFPAVLQFFPNESIELFIEVAPKMGIKFPLEFPVWGVEGGAGFRFWF